MSSDRPRARSGKRRGDEAARPSELGFDLSRRTSGILLHVTALPGRHGSGDLGPEAYRFVDFLAAAGQTWWQMLPVGPPGRAPSYSPYDSCSAFAGSPWLVSPDAMAERGLLARRSLVPPALGANRVDFGRAIRWREACLRRAFVAFRRRRGEHGHAFRAFRAANADWLEDFALFAALRGAFPGRPWTDWERGLRDRQPQALQAARERWADEVAAERFVQFELERQWRALRSHARASGIGLIGDLPLFVGHDSADVWSHPQLFQLDRRGRPRRVSGYPPDRFAAEGQHWGHPQYDWPAHARTGFAWWVRRVERLLERFDVLRIDHFLGLTRTWSIPARAATAREGRWVPSPGSALLAAIEKRLGPRPLIAEDLGRVTPADLRLRDAFGLAPMRVLQFGFGGEEDAALHLPHRYPCLAAAYSGTHDSDTYVGWFRHLRAQTRRRVLAYTGGSAQAPHLAAIRALMASPANVVVFPMQDVLGLDGRARFNVPGTSAGNWQWRLGRRRLDAPARWLRQLVEACGRATGMEKQ